MKFVIFVVLSLIVAALAQENSSSIPELDESSASNLKETIRGTLGRLRSYTLSQIEMHIYKADQTKLDKLNALYGDIASAFKKLDTLAPWTEMGQKGLVELQAQMYDLEARVNSL